MAARIEDYAMIGDCHTAALVSLGGSIDWLCFPRFDSPACFAALIGGPENGKWQIAPAAEVRAVRRRYRGDTLILETDFETDHGAATLIDFMPVQTGAADVMRLVQGRRGEVPMHMDLTIRTDYGSTVPWVRHTDRGIRAVAGPDTLHCNSDVPMHGEDLHTVADFTVAEGQTVWFTLTWSPTHRGKSAGLDWLQSLAATEKWWRRWAARCTYRGEWRDAVVRSLLTLKALTYKPTGAIVAAPTTSLPERIGGVRNWDYRYCWLRDATFTLYALLTGGYIKEAKDWREWLVRAVAGTPSEIQIMYGLRGERRLTELELGWLSGYEGSAPVRIGNAAHKQFQLDVYGEVIAAMHLAREAGLAEDENAWRVQRDLLKFLDSGWKEPDEGIWEVRGPRRHFTHSKVMAWVAVDRAVKAAERFRLAGDVNAWRALRDQIHEDVCRQGFDPQRNSFVQYYGSKDPDASLLVLPLVGFLPASDPRIRGTVDLIQRELTDGPFVYRYPPAQNVDGLPAGEGAFLLCTFWLADNLALQGCHAEARGIMEQMLDLCNDVGLLPEQYSVVDRRFLGNFPQAFSHVGLINAARSLRPQLGPAVPSIPSL
jgi:GH15 family glucan-1,4-alpha-glucosidase